MYTVFKRTLGRVRASEALKAKTAQFVLRSVETATPVQPAGPSFARPLRMKRLAAAACAVLLLGALPLGAYAYYTPASYVSVDINPSVELGVNAFGKIVTVKAYNADGETVLNGLSLLNMNIGKAVRLIVASAADNGFVQHDGSSLIAITVESNNDAKADTLVQDAETGAEDALTSGDTAATIETSQIGLDRRDEAIALGITPGKLNLIEKLHELDPDTPLEVYISQYQYASVKDIQKKFIELKTEEKEQTQMQEQEQEQIQNQENHAQNDTPDEAKNQGQNKKAEQNGSTSTGASVSPSAAPSPAQSALSEDGIPAGSGNGNGTSHGKNDNDKSGQSVTSKPAPGNSGNSNAGGNANSAMKG